MDKASIIEKLVTVLVFTGLFLPARLFFYTYVSQYWAGSFGLMTAILLVTMYMARRGMMGYVGRAIHKHTMSFSKGRYGKFSMFYLLFTIYLLSNAIYGIEHPPALKDSVVESLRAEGITDLETATAKSENLRWSGPAAEVYGPLFSILIILIPNSLGYSVYSIMNDWSQNWLLHFFTVFLIEEIEILGLVVYFRYFARERQINKC